MSKAVRRKMLEYSECDSYSSWVLASTDMYVDWLDGENVGSSSRIAERVAKTIHFAIDHNFDLDPNSFY